MITEILSFYYFLHLFQVRFQGHDNWSEFDWRRWRLVGAPEVYEPGWYVEAIDASGSTLVYEGFNNLRNLMMLKYLDVSYNDYIDNWCVDRITGEYHESLEHLDLSGCVAVTAGGLECLWRLKNLKTLVLYDLDHIQDLPLLCILLLEIFPHLDIKGVDYIDAKMLEGTEHAHLLQEMDDLRLIGDGTAEEGKEGKPEAAPAN